MKFYNNGVYLINGSQIVEDGPEAIAKIKATVGKEVTKDAAHKETMAYGILANHNVSGNMDHLQITSIPAWRRPWQPPWRRPRGAAASPACKRSCAPYRRR